MPRLSIMNPDRDSRKTTRQNSCGSIGGRSAPSPKRFACNSLQLSAAAVLRMLAPKCNSAVYSRLVRERVRTAADLSALDKDDLRDLGLTMVERGRIMRWAKEAGGCAGAGSPALSQDTSPGTPGYGFGMEICSAARAPWMPELSPAVSLGEDDYEDESAKKLDDIEQQADFWCSLVSTASPMPRRRSVEKGCCDVRENVLEDWFDVTSERVAEVYNDMHKASLDPMGGISVHELGQGLRRCGLVGLDESALAKVIEAVKPRRNGRLKLAEFETILSRLKLGQLFMCPYSMPVNGEDHGFLRWAPVGRDECGDPLHAPVVAMHLSVVDYNSHQCHTMEVTDSRFREFCFGHRARPQHSHESPLVRWAHLTEFDLTALLCITVKYSLHPLCVEDVIEQCPTKIDRYGCNYFAAVEQLCLVGDPDTRGSGASPVRVAGFHVAAFCSGPPLFDTVITMAQPDRSFASDWPGGAASEAATSRWDMKLRQRLTTAPRSRLRERRADFILYQIIDLSTDELQAVILAYTARLGRLENSVSGLHAQCVLGEESLDLCTEASTCRLQLKVVLRRVRGLQRLLRHFSGDPDFTADLSGYLQDVAEHLDEAYEDAAQLVDKCTAIIESQHRAVDRRDEKVHQRTADRLNKTLFVLTVGTFVFAPMQFLAAVYGMNFVNEDGVPTIPELLWKRGYLFFWLALLGYLMLMLLFTCWWYFRIHRRGAEDALCAQGADEFIV